MCGRRRWGGLGWLCVCCKFLIFVFLGFGGVVFLFIFDGFFFGGRAVVENGPEKGFEEIIEEWRGDGKV